MAFYVEYHQLLKTCWLVICKQACISHVSFQNGLHYTVKEPFEGNFTQLFRCFHWVYCTIYTVLCQYSAAKFLPNIHKRHPIAHPLGRVMECLFGVQTLIDFLPPFLQWYVQYHIFLISRKYHVYITTHYNDVIMRATASQITSLTSVYSIVYSRCRTRKASKLRVTGLCAGNSPVTGECFHLMTSSWMLKNSQQCQLFITQIPSGHD